MKASSSSSLLHWSTTWFFKLLTWSNCMLLHDLGFKRIESWVCFQRCRSQASWSSFMILDSKELEFWVCFQRWSMGCSLKVNLNADDDRIRMWCWGLLAGNYCSWTAVVPETRSARQDCIALHVQLLDMPSLPLTVHAVMPLPLLHSLRWWSSSSYAHLHHHPSSSCLLESCSLETTWPWSTRNCRLYIP